MVTSGSGHRMNLLKWLYRQTQRSGKSPGAYCLSEEIGEEMFDYNSKEWQRKRNMILKRDGYACQLSKREGIRAEADTVHHIFPVREYPQYALCTWNLISLSRAMHNTLHDRDTDELTEEGMALLRETALRQGIDLMDEGVTLVIGKPGTGKTTWAKKHMTVSTLVYDLDYIAAAFRLEAGTTNNKQARWMANDLLQGFVIKASTYASHVIIIRTAPSVKELDAIQPERIIFLTKEHRKSEINIPDFDMKLAKIKLWASDNNVPIKTSPPV